MSASDSGKTIFAGSFLAKFDLSNFANKALDGFDAVASLADGSSHGSRKLTVVVIVHRNLGRDRSLVLDRALDAAASAVTIPVSVIESKLHLLLDVAGEIVRRHPAGVDVEGGLAARVVFVDEAKLGRVPGVPVGWTHEAPLARAGDTLQFSAKGEIDQLDVVDGDVGAGVSPLDPFGKLPARNGFGLKQMCNSRC